MSIVLAGNKTNERSTTIGYTHHVHQKIWDKKDADGYKAALPTLQKILKKHEAIIRYESDETNAAVCNEDGIRCNGIGENGHETFLFEPKECDYSFCKTARKPYDLPVCEMLLVLKAYIPHFELSSDGFSGYAKDPKIDGFWGAAIENVKQYGIFYTIKVESQGPGREQYVNITPVFDKFYAAVAAGMKPVKKMKKPSKKEILAALKDLMASVKAVADNGGFIKELHDEFCKKLKTANEIIAKS